MVGDAPGLPRWTSHAPDSVRSRPCPNAQQGVDSLVRDASCEQTQGHHVRPSLHALLPKESGYLGDGLHVCGHATGLEDPLE
jgi:hypothetical protein